MYIISLPHLHNVKNEYISKTLQPQQTLYLLTILKSTILCTQQNLKLTVVLTN